MEPELVWMDICDFQGTQEALVKLENIYYSVRLLPSDNGYDVVIYKLPCVKSEEDYAESSIQRCEEISSCTYQDYDAADTGYRAAICNLDKYIVKE